MALDYSQRKQVSRNRPKKRSTKPFLLLILGVISGVYALGIGTGWLLFRGSAHDVPPVASEATETAAGGKAAESSSASKDSANSPSPAAKDNEAPLTFYYTLPKGDKGVIGSGVNLRPDEGAPLPKRDPSELPQPTVKQQQPAKSEKMEGTTKTAVAVKEKPPRETPPAPAREKATGAPPLQQSKDSGKGNYTVQVGSYYDKSEAHNLKASLAKNGFSARIVEHTVQGKGTLYRVRIGNRMEQEAAAGLAAKVGKNAIAVPE